MCANKFTYCKILLFISARKKYSKYYWHSLIWINKSILKFNSVSVLLDTRPTDPKTNNWYGFIIRYIATFGFNKMQKYHTFPWICEKKHAIKASIHFFWLSSCIIATAKRGGEVYLKALEKSISFFNNIVKPQTFTTIFFYLWTKIIIRNYFAWSLHPS